MTSRPLGREYSLRRSDIGRQREREKRTDLPFTFLLAREATQMLSDRALTQKLVRQLIEMGYDEKNARRIVREWKAR